MGSQLSNDLKLVYHANARDHLSISVLLILGLLGIPLLRRWLKELDFSVYFCVQSEVCGIDSQ